MFRVLLKKNFAPHPDRESESEECLVSEPLFVDNDRTGSPPKPVLQKLNSTSYSLIISLILTTNLLTFFTTFHLGRLHPTDNSAIRRVSRYSPVIDQLPFHLHITQFNGSFIHENIYRQNASREVDQAWDDLGIGFRPLVLPESLIEKAGLNTDHARIKAKYGGGYPVFVEGLHQLHCLDLLRKNLYYNHEYYQVQGKIEFGDPDNVQRLHTSHCLDFLRQKLMCNMDIGVFGSVWVNVTNPYPFPDFNTKHVCRDFNAIREWARRNQVPENIPDDWLETPTKGDGANIWEFPP